MNTGPGGDPIFSLMTAFIRGREGIKRDSGAGSAQDLIDRRAVDLNSLRRSKVHYGVGIGFTAWQDALWTRPHRFVLGGVCVSSLVVFAVHTQVPLRMAEGGIFP